MGDGDGLAGAGEGGGRVCLEDHIASVILYSSATFSIHTARLTSFLETKGKHVS